MTDKASELLPDSRLEDSGEPRLIVVLIILALLVASCGGNDGATETSAGVASESTVATTSPQPEAAPADPNTTQLARHLGAEVTGVCITANVEFVASLGATRVVGYTVEVSVGRVARSARPSPLPPTDTGHIWDGLLS